MNRDSIDEGIRYGDKADAAIDARSRAVAACVKGDCERVVGAVFQVRADLVGLALPAWQPPEALPVQEYLRQAIDAAEVKEDRTVLPLSRTRERAVVVGQSVIGQRASEPLALRGLVGRRACVSLQRPVAGHPRLAPAVDGELGGHADGRPEVPPVVKRDALAGSGLLHNLQGS